MSDERDSRTFYAFEHAFGVQVADRRGWSLGRVVGFASRAERDAWVAARRTEYSTQPGWREPISSTAREVRWALRAGEVDMMTEAISQMDSSAK